MKKTVEKTVKNAVKFKLIRSEEDKNAIKEAIEIRNAIEMKERIKEGIAFFARNSANIEVVRNNTIEKVHFILMPHHKQLPKETKAHFHENVDRISLKSKISGLIEKTPSLMEIAKHELALKQFFAKYKFIAIFANFVHLWKDLAFFLSIVLNIFVLFSYSEFFPEGTQSRQDARWYSTIFFLDSDVYSHSETNRIFDAMGISMIFCSSFVVLFYLLKKLPLLLKVIWVDPPGTQQQKRGIIKHAVRFVTRVIKTIFKFMQNADILYYIGYIVFAIIGLTLHHFFFAYHLLEVLLRFPTLRDVLYAVWEPKRSIFLLIVLLLITEYVFSLFAFQYLYRDFDGYCNSVLICFLSNIDFTFKGNGGVGGILIELNNENSSQFYNGGRFIYDYLATMLVFVLMISILAGIIIDTFGSMREKDEEKRRDINDFCFICGHSRETFERQADSAISYANHIKIEHHMWNYAYYIDYLKSKDETEYTGMESYIREKLDRGDITWFPLNRALCLSGVQDGEHAVYQKIYQNFQEEIDEIRANLKQMSELHGGLFLGDDGLQFDKHEQQSPGLPERTLRTISNRTNT